MASLELPRPSAFVLSGGASLGAVQVGALRAAHRHGVHPDLVVGTSVGAINGAMVAAEPDAATDHLTRVWTNLERGDVFPGGLVRQLRTLASTRHHLFSNRALATLIRMNTRVQRLEELDVPFAAVATDALTGHAVTLTRGPIVPALLASAAIPGVFSPVQIEGRTLVDGGIAANTPLAIATDMGAASAVVFDVGYPCHREAPPANIAESLLFASAHLLRSQGLVQARIASSRIPVIWLPTPCPTTTSPFDFSATDALMDDTETLVDQFLSDAPEIVGPGVYGAIHTHVDEERDLSPTTYL